jgi:nucleoside-diphosphate-sugar epimerase
VKQVLIIGADDFIGQHVTSAVAACGWATPIAGVSRNTNGMSTSIRRVHINAADRASVSDALQGVDAVVNCLTGSPQAIASGAHALFVAAAGVRPIPLIVHLSSMSVYGSVNGDVSEHAPLRDDLGPYARAKVQAEALATGYPRAVILRPGCEYGPEGELWSGRIARWLFAHRIGDLGAAGDGFCNLLHIDDLAAAVVLCLQRSEAVGAAFNLAIADPPTWNEYFVRFAQALGAVPVKRISRRSLAFETKVLAAPLKALEIATRAAGLDRFSPPPPIPPSLLALMRQEIRLLTTRAQRELGWSCKPLDEGLDEAATWFLRKSGRSEISAGRDIPWPGSSKRAP